MRRLPVLLLTIATTTLLIGCPAPSETATTQTSEVVVLEDEPSRSTDPFDQEYLVDGEPALTVRGNVKPPRRVKVAERRSYSYNPRNICFPRASVVVVVDKQGKVQEAQLVDFENAWERFKGQPSKELSFDETLEMLDEMIPGIYEWEYLPAMLDGEPVPVKIEGGWRLRCR